VLDSLAWPPGYRYSFGGSTKNMQESFTYAVGALALAVVFIYMILASQFRSFLQPLALMAFGSSLSMFSMIGVIMLMGLVTKNAILLVDFANHARKDGASVPEALLQAGLIRMRPILMTTSAMVFGMLPMALALNDGGEIQAPMGRAIIGGVITSTLLTLVVVPVLYSYLVRDKVAKVVSAADEGPAHGGSQSDVHAPPGLGLGAAALGASPAHKDMGA
ncbi:MAG: hypothetical protein RL375_3010, partial [Pseudomonadota bacterium]